MCIQNNDLTQHRNGGPTIEKVVEFPSKEDSQDYAD